MWEFSIILFYSFMTLMSFLNILNLAVVWTGSFPLPFPPFPSASYFSFLVFLCVSRRAYWRGREVEEGRGKEPNYKTARKPSSLTAFRCSALYWSQCRRLYIILLGGVFWVFGVCSLVAVPKCMQSCYSVKSYTVFLRCQSVCSLVCSAKSYADLLLGQSVHYAVLLQCQSDALCTDKKKIKCSSYIRKFWVEQLQSHIWGRASPFMRKRANISPCMRRPLVIYDFATAPLWISLYIRKTWFSFFYQCAVLLQCQSVCTLQSSCSAKWYVDLLLCQSVCTMQSCCSAKVYSMQYAVLLQSQSVCTIVCSLVAVPKCMQICCSANVYAVLLQCQTVCSLVSVTKCMQICCSAKVYADLLQCRRTCNFCNEECRDLSDFCGQITDDICRSEDSKYHCKRWPLFYAVALIKSSTASGKIIVFFHMLIALS